MSGVETETIRPSSSLYCQSEMIHGDEDSLSAYISSHADATSHVPLDGSFSFAFEHDLQASRVYERNAHRHSHYSLPSSTGISRGWSYLSGLSLSEISDISVIALPIALQEVYSSSQYRLESSCVTGEATPLILIRPAADEPKSYIIRREQGAREYTKMSSTRTEISVGEPPQSLSLDDGIHIEKSFSVKTIDATEAAATWQSEKIGRWLRRNGLLLSSTIEQVVTDDISGFSIMIINPNDLYRMGIRGMHEQRQLWSAIQRLQTVIFDELFDKQSKSAIAQCYTSFQEQFNQGQSDSDHVREEYPILEAHQPIEEPFKRKTGDLIISNTSFKRVCWNLPAAQSGMLRCILCLVCHDFAIIYMNENKSSIKGSFEG